MFLYKIFRYMCFLGMVFLSVLYFVPRELFPITTPFFNQIDSLSQWVLNYFVEDNSEEGEQNLSFVSEELLKMSKESIDNFFGDLSTKGAIEMAISRNAEDLSFLIDTYLGYNANFEDLILSYNNAIIYKRNQSTSSNPIIFEYELQTGRGNVNTQILFDSSLIQEFVDIYDGVILIHDGSNLFVARDAQDDFYYIDDYIPVDDGVYEIDNYYKIHKKTLFDSLKNPIMIFYIEKKSFMFINIVRIGLFVLFLIFIMLILVLDKKIVEFLQLRKNQKAYKEFLNKNVLQDKNEEDNLDWLDDFVREEEENIEK